MKRQILILFLSLLAGGILPAQANRDSLWQVWSNTRLEDTARLHALHRLVGAYANQNPDSARLLAQWQLDFANKTGSLHWQARALNSIALSYRSQSDFQKAIQYFEQAIAILEKNGDRNFLSAVYGNMGDVYRLQSNFPKAIDCITKSLSLAEALGDRRKVADSYIGIATIYFDVPDSDDKTLEYLEKARKEYDALDDEEGLALVYGNLAAIYLNQDSLDMALDMNEKSMALQQKLGDLRGLATSLHNRAVIRGSQGRYAEAMADFEREATIFESMGDQEGLADACNSIGDLWIQQKRYPAAIQMCEKGLQIARQIGSPYVIVADACDCLYRAYREQGNYKKSLEYLQAFMLVKDSLQKNETAQQLKQMEIQRQLALDSLGREKEKFRMEMAHQDALRRKDRSLSWLAAGGLGVLAAALAVWVRMLYFRRRSHLLQIRSEELEKQQLLNEVALLRTQVNPHFLFNSLSILSSLVHVDANLSERFIEQLSRSYRYILEQKEQTLVTLRTELEFIESYTFLLKIRFENKFDLKIDLPEALLDTRKIAPLTLQLLIENAVKHNRMSEKEPLIVTVTAEGDELVVRNRLQPRATPAISTGMGLQNIQSRYALLSDRPVWAGESGGDFVVRAPLL